MNVIASARMFLIALAICAAIGVLLWGLVVEGHWEPTPTPIVPGLGGDPAGPRS